jgi:hypothetical protein
MLKSIRPQRNAWPRVRLSLARFAKLESLAIEGRLKSMGQAMKVLLWPSMSAAIRSPDLLVNR